MTVLTVKEISIAFSGVKALHNLSFSVPEKSIAGLIGPNGAGKTTFFNVVTRILDPDKGELFFKGENILNCRPHDIARKGIFRTFQTPQIFKRLTVCENILLGSHLSFKSGLIKCAFWLPKARKEEAKRRCEAKKILDEIGLSAFANWKAENISHVCQRRLEIGRALFSEPSLLLLDEPAAGMTLEEKENIVHLIKQINIERGITIIIVEHDIKLIRTLCDHMVVLNFGEKIAEGAPEEVSKREVVREAYLGDL